MTDRADRADESFARRAVLGSLGAGTAVGLAGCLGGFGDDDEDENGNDRHPYEARMVEHDGGEPIEFTDDQACAVCNMTPAGYPAWKGQLAHENGEGAVFDTPGCLFAYYVVPPVDDSITDAWVTDFETGELIDATEAYFVIVTNEDAVSGETMGINPRPFADREDAVSYLDEWDGEELTEDDIIGLSDVSREIAEIYRGNRMPAE
ncbi:NosL family protein [Natrialba magadii ATCC 43099]|uniref:Lipoprotein n=1 Tax=Natrialba magadii (strain ATCC 43099 / DSM 3394 / CCM 3739 / CIP 104546 / IAM 13178 / JCM 8861 / NBRC 102185 / NCIMB 2190 / MS3) TaxID=547559 RepID=D3SXG7_NATMM|nr:nitrous oxide reductase accessory protein NosL [Natrialba magadii]ADD05916.1 NosL family protein [Natrialba magadii ATCC 43099]ELY30577.1 lipoprotein [Natrialba magadii ATCC 43099]